MAKDEGNSLLDFYLEEFFQNQHKIRFADDLIDDEHWGLVLTTPVNGNRRARFILQRGRYVFMAMDLAIKFDARLTIEVESEIDTATYYYNHRRGYPLAEQWEKA